MVRAEDRGDYYRVPLDARSLDYGVYFDEGDERAHDVEDYTSHNTERLDVDARGRAAAQPARVRVMSDA